MRVMVADVFGHLKLTVANQAQVLVLAASPVLIRHGTQEFHVGHLRRVGGVGEAFQRAFLVGHVGGDFVP